MDETPSLSLGERVRVRVFQFQALFHLVAPSHHAIALEPIIVIPFRKLCPFALT
jgi:hypothetical protein